MSLKGIIKLAVSALMLWLVLRVVELDELQQTFRSIPLRLAVTVIILYSLTQLVNCWKWWLIARSAGVTASYPVALRATFVGMFANFFGLGTIGGDMLRGVLLAAGQGKKAEGIASVLADRALGLAVLTLIGLLATIFFNLQLLPASTLAILAGFALCVFGGWFLGPLAVLRYFPHNNRFRRKVERVMGVFPRSPQMMLRLAGISVLFHFMQIGLQWHIVRELGVRAPFSAMLSSVPFVNIVSTLPISWNGLGVRENAYLYFFFPAVLPAREQVIALGAIWLLGVTCSSLIGGLLAWMSGDFQLLGRREELDDL